MRSESVASAAQHGPPFPPISLTLQHRRLSPMNPIYSAKVTHFEDLCVRLHCPVVRRRSRKVGLVGEGHCYADRLNVQRRSVTGFRRFS